MIRKGLMIGVAVLVLLGASAGCAADLEQPPEAPNINLEQPPEAVNIDVVQPPEETNTLTIKGYVIVDAYHYDAATGTYVHFYHHESSNVITTIGLNWIENQLGDTPATDPAKWISLSNDGGSAAGWTKLPTELDDTNGMGRAEGAYASTGDGVWTILKTFTATGAVTVQTTGLQWVVTLQSDNNLMAANDFTSVTLAAADTVTITWTLTLS